LSVVLAKHFSTSVLSADSRQFYTELEIGTAKPTKTEQAGVKHYFIDSHSITEEITAANYEQQALGILENEFKIHDTIVLVGGSGMFIDALCFGLDPIPASKTLRDELTKQVEEVGLNSLLQELEENDPVYFSQVDQKNAMRVIRSIEAIRLSGKPYSLQRKAIPKERDFSIHRFIIDHPREKLYERINLRVDQMLEKGLLEEVKKLEKFKDFSALRTVGYTELFAFLEGKSTYSDAVELIKQNSRRYAKRQLTWFRKHTDAVWIPYDSAQTMSAKILEELSL
jgi:tRNA dimethylallyltransferase